MNPALFLRAACGTALLAVFGAAASAATPDAQQLLKSSDQARGGGLPGLVWVVKASSSGTGAEDFQDQVLEVWANDTSSLARVVEPPNSRDSKMLQVNRNMWISKPSLHKPVAISPRQRLTGQAAVGDIAAINYANDYVATFIREEKVGDEACYVLELKATSRQATYDRINYWVSVSRSVAVQAQFLSVSGKPIKSAQFEYGNTIRVGNRGVPFVSHMAIADALTDARTTLDFSKVKVQPVPQSEFDVSNLR